MKRFLRRLLNDSISILIIPLFLQLLVVGLLLVADPYRLKGGEIIKSDFKDGFEIYVALMCQDQENEIFQSGTKGQVFYQITENNAETEIYDLCSNIKRYRECISARDIVLGLDSLVPNRYPVIYIDTKNYAYKIELFDWECFKGPEWGNFLIKQEKAGQPLIWFFRMKKDTEKMVYPFEMDFSGPDSINSEDGYGWYSELSEKDFTELLDLCLSVGTKNSNVIK